MKNCKNYEIPYFMPPECSYELVKRDHIKKAPIWCSVDLRDGNQALVEPMNLNEKLAFFQMLVDIGFKEIEVAFPSASETEYEFVRALIERDMIPDDVTIQVLTQSREHIIRKTFEAELSSSKAIAFVCIMSDNASYWGVGIDEDIIKGLHLVILQKNFTFRSLISASIFVKNPERPLANMCLLFV